MEAIGIVLIVTSVPLLLRGFFGIVIADWRTANRWARERRTATLARTAHPIVLGDLPKEHRS